MSEDLSLRQKKSLFIRAHAAYHTGAESPISDDSYDALKRDLKAADPTWEPLHVAGWKPNVGNPLKKVKHSSFMGSIANAFDCCPSKTRDDQKWEVGFESWFTRNKNEPVMGTLKLDGASVVLHYVDGELVSAITRGDCVEGESVLHHVINMRSVPLFIQARLPLAVRGEVLFTTSRWNDYLKTYPEAKNARNMAAGILGRKETNDDQYLAFFAHGLSTSDSHILDEIGIRDFASVFNWLQANDFSMPIMQLSFSTTHCKEFYNLIAKRRESNDLPYEIDGIVFSINSLKTYTDLGIDSDRCPKGSIAWKFPAMTAITTLYAVDWQVGHTGALTPVALLKPVTIGGVTVSRASLANPKEIERLGVGIDDVVEISRQGDVIPKVIRVVDKKNDDLVPSPKKCPACEGAVGWKKKVKGESGAVLYCLNSDCEAQSLGRIYKWVSSLKMDGIGKTLIEAMVAANLIETPADLYSELMNVDSLASMPYGKLGHPFGTLRAQKIIEQIEAKRSMPLSVFLGALGIPGLGERVVENVQVKAPGKFDTLDDWTHSRKLIEMKDELNIPNTAEAIWKGIRDRIVIISNMISNGVKITTDIAHEAPKTGTLSDMVFCLTGDFPEKKAVYYEAIKEAGGTVEEDVRSNVTHVVVNKKDGAATSKQQKAIKKGIPVITILELSIMMTGGTVMEVASGSPA